MNLSDTPRPTVIRSIQIAEALADVVGITLRARIDFSIATKRTRNAVLKALNTGYVSQNTHRGAGLLADALLRASGVFYMASQSRGYTSLRWEGELPPGMNDPIERLREADETATKVSGKHYSEPARHWRGQHFLHFQTIKPHEHVPEYMVELVTSPEYQAAVKPYVDMVQRGLTVDVDVKVRKPNPSSPLGRAQSGS